MDSKAIIGLSICGVLGGILIILSIVLLSGHGANLIAGFNTLTKKKNQNSM